MPLYISAHDLNHFDPLRPLLDKSTCQAGGGAQDQSDLRVSSIISFVGRGKNGKKLQLNCSIFVKFRNKTFLFFKKNE